MTVRSGGSGHPSHVRTRAGVHWFHGEQVEALGARGWIVHFYLVDKGLDLCLVNWDDEFREPRRLPVSMLRKIDV